MSRRLFLASATIATVGGLAGCLGDILDSEPEETRLSNVVVRNIGDNEEHEVEVTIEDNGDTVLSDNWYIKPRSQRGEVEIATERGRYVVRIGFEEAEQEVDVTGEADGEDVCINLRFDVWIDDDGDPRIATAPQPSYDDC